MEIFHSGSNIYTVPENVLLSLHYYCQAFTELLFKTLTSMDYRMIISVELMIISVELPHLRDEETRVPLPSTILAQA